MVRLVFIRLICYLLIETRFRVRFWKMPLDLMKTIKSDLEFELESYFQRRLSSSFHDQMEKIEKNEKSGKESERKIKPIKSSDGVKDSKKRSIKIV